MAPQTLGFLVYFTTESDTVSDLMLTCRTRSATIGLVEAARGRWHIPLAWSETIMSELMVFGDLPVKPAVDATRTPALIGKEVDLIMRRTREHVTLASIAIGYRLMEAKRLEGHGGWLPWLAARDINERTARRTIELASHHQHLTDTHPERLPDFMGKSLRAALAIVHEERAAKRGQPHPPGKGRGKAAGAEQDAPEVEILPPDPIHLLHHLVQQWPAADIARHTLSGAEADLLEQDLPVLLPALLELAERHDVSTGLEPPELALSGPELWAAERRNITSGLMCWFSTAPVDKIVAALVEAVPRARLAEISAALFNRAAAPAPVEPEAALRQRLAAALAGAAMDAGQFSDQAGIKGDAVAHFLDGKGLSYHNRPKVEKALAALSSTRL